MPTHRFRYIGDKELLQKRQHLPRCNWSDGVEAAEKHLRGRMGSASEVDVQVELCAFWVKTSKGR